MANPIASFPLAGGKKLEIAQGDLTQERVDAIVNAANASLAHGAGIAAAIVHAGGPVIQRESNAWIRKNGPVSHDRPAFTGAGALPCRYVIHAVGPMMGEGEEDRKLAAAVAGSLRLAGELGLRSIAIPAISTGIFGYPKQRAAAVFLQAIPAFFAENQASTLERVRLTLWEPETVAIFVDEAKRVLGAPGAL